MSNRWSEQYRAWLVDAAWLVNHWHPADTASHWDGLRAHRWVSPDGFDEHHVAMWGGRGIDPLHYPWLHGWISDACVKHSSTWHLQYEPFRSAAGDFFNAMGTPAVMNFIVVTPSRMPSGEWLSWGRTPIIERLDVDSFGPQQMKANEATQLKGLSIDMSMIPDHFGWSHLRGKASAFVQNAVDRKVGRYALRLNRLFWMDTSSEQHFRAVQSGSIPSVLDARVRIRERWRTHSPMIHFWRLDEFRMINLLLIELSSDSGEVSDIRWTRQTFESLVMHDPYFGAAIRSTLVQGREFLRR